MADGRTWPALEIEAPRADTDGELDGRLGAVLADFDPTAIHDLIETAPPPGGVWDPLTVPAAEPPAVPLHWRVFFATAADRDAAARETARCFPDLRLAGIDVDDEDWARRSQRALTAVHAGRFVIAPPWDIPSQEAMPAATLIVIDPSMGFGTGHHASTRLCLRALSEIDVTGRTVLDIGTGSGVLSLAAAEAGACTVTGVDVDADAIANARHNATLNTPPLTPAFVVADFRTAALAPADIVLANLTGGMLRATAETLRSLVAPGGTLIVSGFERDEAAAVEAALAPWALARTLDEAGWLAACFTAR